MPDKQKSDGQALYLTGLIREGNMMSYCRSCQKELPAVQKGLCPYCGFQNEETEKEFVFARRYLLREAFNNDENGISYRGFDTVMGRNVLLRRFWIKDNAPADGQNGYQNYERRKNFMDTYRILASMEVSSLPAVYTVKSDGTDAYAVSACPKGQRLSQFLLQNGVASYEATKILLLPVLVALKLMHDRKICHGNVSLESIYRTEKNTVLCDAVGGTDSTADIRAFLMVFLSMLCGKTMNGAGGFGGLTLPEEVQTCMQSAFCSDSHTTADEILDTLYHCGEVAIAQPANSIPAPPPFLLSLAEECGVKVTTLLTSLT